MTTNCSNKKDTTSTPGTTNIASATCTINTSRSTCTPSDTNTSSSTCKTGAMKTCPRCKGTGLVKTDIVLCSNCKVVGDGCYRCKSGIITMPWSECENCLGLGEIKIG